VPDLIETARLRLAAVSTADVDDLVQLDADPAVMAYVNGGRPTSRAAVEQMLRIAHLHRWAARDLSGAFVGWFSLRPTAPDGSDAELELSYRLRRVAWGRGLATEGASAVVGFAFDVLGAALVWGQAVPANAASLRVMERCGLRFVRSGGGSRSDLEYRLTRAQWAARGAGAEAPRSTS
jgi:RimJ/RimL family protein N-acetyltransferase